MPDFTWTRAHALLRPRAELRADFERLGYRFTESEDSMGHSAPADGRLKRPRSVGVKTDGSARLELIGPPEVAFKATLLATTPVGDTATSFLRVMTPSWTDGPEWLRTRLSSAQTYQTVETHYEDFRVTLRHTRGGKELILGLTWEPR